MSAHSLMTQFPLPADRQVTLANWRKPPFNRWSFNHVNELVPSAPIRNDPARVGRLPEGAADFSSFSVQGSGGRLDLEGFLEATYTDAVVVLHRGRFVLERYAPGMDARTPHILMSVSKSVLGLVAGILLDEGILELGTKITSVVPEMAGTAFEGTSVRDLLDMRVGVLFDENYLASAGPIIEYRKAQLWDPLDPSDLPSDLRSFISGLRDRDGAHSDRFHYVSPNTDLLGWVIERSAARRYADLVSELLWQPMGAEADAYITVDRLGAPRCAGGLCATARDLARIGRLFATEGSVGGRQVVSAHWLEDILTAGDGQAWQRGDFTNLFPTINMHYRSKWYVERGPRPIVFALGVFGQNVFTDPAADLVIAKVSSQPLALDRDFNMLTHAGIAEIRRLFEAGALA